MDIGELVVWQKTGSLGDGAFGKVYSGFRLGDPNKTIFAIKVSKGAGSTNNLLVKEIDIHSRLTHPHIVKYVTSYELEECGGMSLKQAMPGAGKCVALVLEYLKGKDAESRTSEDAPGFSYREIQKMAKNMISALLYLKEQKIIHRDIKPANIFIDESGTFKLGDFGLALKEEDVKYLNKNILIGTPLYMSYELLLRLDLPSYESDMWALGITIHESFYGAKAWTAATLAFLKEQVSKLQINKTTRQTPQDLQGFFDAIFINDKTKRITVEEAVGHPLLQFSRTPENNEEKAFLQNLKEFGLGTREQFYVWLADKYPNESPMSWAKFNEMYDRLYIKPKA